MKEQTLQMKPQKYKGSKETTTKNFMPTNWITQKKLIHSEKHTTYQD